MKVLVLYYSKGGNTRRLAEAVLKGIESVPGVQGIFKHTDDVTKEDFIDAAGIIAGSPVYFGTMAAPLKAVMDDFVGVRRKMEGKVGAAFATSGDPTGGKETTIMSILQAFLIYGMVITGDPLSATGHYGVACAGAPDDKT
ncbi:MAG: flavodoxin, partial [Desulfobacterales bacterium RIFOXYA12_FULL_46_15]